LGADSRAARGRYLEPAARPAPEPGSGSGPGAPAGRGGGTYGGAVATADGTSSRYGCRGPSRGSTIPRRGASELPALTCEFRCPPGRPRLRRCVSRLAAITEGARANADPAKPPGWPPLGAADVARRRVVLLRLSAARSMATGNVRARPYALVLDKPVDRGRHRRFDLHDARMACRPGRPGFAAACPGRRPDQLHRPARQVHTRSGVGVRRSG